MPPTGSTQEGVEEAGDGGAAPGGVGEVAATSTVLSRLRATRERRRGCGEEAGRGGARRFGGGVDAWGDTVTGVGGGGERPRSRSGRGVGERSEGSWGKWGLWWWIGLGFEEAWGVKRGEVGRTGWAGRLGRPVG